MIRFDDFIRNLYQHMRIVFKFYIDRNYNTMNALQLLEPVKYLKLTFNCRFWKFLFGAFTNHRWTLINTDK